MGTDIGGRGALHVEDEIVESSVVKLESLELMLEPGLSDLARLTRGIQLAGVDDAQVPVLNESAKEMDIVVLKLELLEPMLEPGLCAKRDIEKYLKALRST